MQGPIIWQALRRPLSDVRRTIQSCLPQENMRSDMLLECCPANKFTKSRRRHSEPQAKNLAAAVFAAVMILLACPKKSRGKTVPREILRHGSRCSPAQDDGLFLPSY